MRGAMSFAFLQPHSILLNIYKATNVLVPLVLLPSYALSFDRVLHLAEKGRLKSKLPLNFIMNSKCFKEVEKNCLFPPNMNFKTVTYLVVTTSAYKTFA